MKKALLIMLAMAGVGYGQPTQINAGQAVQFVTTPSARFPQQTGLFILDNVNYPVPLFDVRINGVTGALNHYYPVTSFTTNTTLTLNQIDGLINNSGASGAVTLILPVPTGGQFATFCVDASQTFNVSNVASSALYRYGLTTGVVLSSSTVGSCISVKTTSASQYIIDSLIGTWTLDSVSLGPIIGSNTGEITPYNLPTPAICNGTSDDTAAFNSVVAGTTIVIPGGVTCVMSNFTSKNNVTVRGAGGGTIKKLTGSGASYLFNLSGTNQTFKDLLIDFNGTVQSTSNNAWIFTNNATNTTFDNIVFTNSGAVPTNTGGLLLFSGSGKVLHSKMDATIPGPHYKLDARSGTGKDWLLDGNQSIGSANTGFYITNSQAYTAGANPLNVIVTNNIITNTTAQSGSTGQSGNGITVFQADGVIVSNNKVYNPRFSAVRVNKSINTQVSNNEGQAVDLNTAGGNGGETAVYAELGAFNNTYSNNRMIGFPSCYADTNVSNRSTDLPNIWIGNTCSDAGFYGFNFEHSVGTGNFVIGAAICYKVGNGNTSHDNILGNNSCIPSASITPVMAVGVDKSINTGVDVVANTVKSGTVLSQTAFPISDPDDLTISALTVGATTAVTYTGTEPTTGDTWCFAQVSGTYPINALCGTIASHTPTTLVINVNSTGFPALIIPTGGPNPKMFQTLVASGLPKYTFPSSFRNLNFDSSFNTLTDGATITWNLQGAIVNNASVTLGGNRTLVVQNLLAGGEYNLRVIQDGTGSRGLTLGSGCTWKVSGGGSGAITPTTTANAVDILNFNYDGTNCNAIFTKNFN